jgi:hypothetical protein
MINLRRAAAAPLAVAALALGALVAPASVASAATPSAAVVGAGSTVQKAGGWCTYTSWGGTYYCGSQSWYGINNQLFQVFVIGSNNAVWTRWSNTSGVSGWTSLGGSCEQATNSTSVSNDPANLWFFAVFCKNRNNGAYYNRVRAANGSWSAWSSNPVIFP